MARTIRKTVTVSAPRPEVWRALTDVERFREWAGDEASVDPKVGGGFAWAGIDGKGGKAEIAAIHQGDRLDLVLLERHEDSFDDRDHHLSFSLADAHGGTKVTVTEVDPIDDNDPELRSEVEAIWVALLDDLKALFGAAKH